MDSLDDLLIKRRRGVLRSPEEQRLRAAVRSSREYELALLAGDVFELDGAAQSGDAERLEQLIEATERRWWGAPPSRLRLPRAVRPLVAIPLFLAGAAAASYGTYRALEPARPNPTAHAVEVEPSPPRAPSLAPPIPPQPLGRTPQTTPSPPLPPTPPSTAVQPLAPTPKPRPPQSFVPMPMPTPMPTPTHDATPTPREVQQHPTPRLPPTPMQPSKSSPDPLQRPTSDPTSDPTSESAQSLFESANRLRHSDWSAAAEIYRRLITRYPASMEAGIAEVGLGKWSLSRGWSGDALEWFRAHQRRSGSALAAEALWGEAQALESLGTQTAARAPWQRLLELYPDSPYAAAARMRLDR